MLFQISRLDFDESKRTDPKFGILWFRIQIQKRDSGGLQFQNLESKKFEILNSMFSLKNLRNFIQNRFKMNDFH